MAYRTIETRMIRRKRRKVSVLRIDGKVASVRIANQPHYTDKTAEKLGIKHKKGIVNFPNSANRVNFKRKRSR